jgi:phage tail sheath gpL-like
MVSVPFNNIPGNELVPFFYAEINSGGTPFDGTPRLLLLGQKTSAGSAPAGTVIGPVQSQVEANALFGVGSMLSAMFAIARRNAPFQPIWVLPLADPSGAAAAGSITFTAPGATGVGILHIFGTRITFQINAADSASTICVSARDAINAANLPVIAAQDGTTAAKCNLTARHVGALGNGQQVALATDEPNILAAGNVTIVAMASGSGVPSLTSPLATLGDQEYDFIAGPYCDTTSLNSLRDFLDDTAGRWSPSQQLYGHYFTVDYGSLSTLVTFANGRNDQHVTIMASQVTPTTQWEFAAALAGMASAHLGSAPEVSRPLQTLVLEGVQPPVDRSTWWDYADRQALYADGLAGYRVRQDGLVALDRVCTTYQKTAANIADGTFRDVETMFQLMYLTRFIKTAVVNNHSRQALADDNPFNVGGLATPKSIRNTIIHAYNDLVALGVTENAPLFNASLIVVRNGTDANRVDAYLPVDVVNQLRVFAANITAFLQLPTPSTASA